MLVPLGITLVFYLDMRSYDKPLPGYSLKVLEPG